MSVKDDNMSDIEEYKKQYSTSETLKNWKQDDRIPSCIYAWLDIAAEELDTMNALVTHWRETYGHVQEQIGGLQALNKGREDMLIRCNERVKKLKKEPEKLHKRIKYINAEMENAWQMGCLTIDLKDACQEGLKEIEE